MSRIGRKPILLPAGVTVVAAGQEVRAEGPKGKISFPLVEGIGVAVEDRHGRREVLVTRGGDDRRLRAMHGTTRAIVQNMVRGVAEGFTKALQVWGVGYSAEVKGRTLYLAVGYRNPVEVLIPPGLEVKASRISVEGTNVWQITVSGVDRQAVGQLASEIRKVRPPEPYKGKGIRYEGERIVRKAGKSFQSGAGG